MKFETKMMIDALVIATIIVTAGVLIMANPSTIQTEYKLTSTDNSKVQLVFYKPAGIIRDGSYKYEGLPNTIIVAIYDGSKSFYLEETWIENGTALDHLYGPFSLNFSRSSWQSLPVYYLNLQNVTVTLVR